MLTFNSMGLPITNTKQYESLFSFGTPNNTAAYGDGVNLHRSLGGIPQTSPLDLGTNPFGIAGSTVEANPQTSWMDSLFGEKGKTALGGIGMLGNLYMGMQNYGLAKDAFNLQKENYERNYQAQRQLTNSRIEDRQRARVAANPTAYESVDSYMDRNRVQ